MRIVLTILSILLVLFIVELEPSLASSSNNVDTLIRQSINDLSIKIQDFQTESSRRLRRPFVTLAYAQSIDGKIALVLEDHPTSTSSNFAISGPESLRLTHALRSIHDAILVGGRTLSVDNPRLTNRLWPVTHETSKPCIPVVLDTHLHHIRSLGGNMRAHNPIVCCSQQSYEQACVAGSIPSSVRLLPCGTRVVKQTNGEAKEVLDLHDVLSRLHEQYRIKSLMVEGGASVLSMFATGDPCENNDKDTNDESSLFDCLCVTISPKLLGSNGLDAVSSFGGSNQQDFVALGPLKCISLGEDCVLFADRKRLEEVDLERRVDMECIDIV